MDGLVVKVLFFSPHSYFMVHTLPEMLVAESLAHEGSEIVVVHCDGFYAKHCLCMNVPFDDWRQKERICEACRRNREEVKREFGFRTAMIENFITDDERALVAAQSRALKRDSYFDVKLDGFPIAQFALYEFWLNHKLSSADISLEHWEEYRAIFENTVSTYYAMKRMLEQEKPDRVACYNALYSVNRITVALAERMGIPHFTLHAGRHHARIRQQMTIFRGIGGDLTVNRLPEVEAYRKRPCTKEEIDIVTEHVQELLKASSPWVYSIKSTGLSSADLTNRLGVEGNQKVLLAVMRSNDERFAGELVNVPYLDGNPLFTDQYEWLRWLAEFAENNKDYFIVYRVHPREFPNKRETVFSQNAVKFMNVVESLKLPANFHINTPEDKLSLYDILKITDVMLNNSSTAGLEGSLFGIPVIGIGDQLYSFDRALQAEATSIDDYERKIRHATVDGWRFSRVVLAYRWLNFLNAEFAIDIADGYRNPPLFSNFLTQAFHDVKTYARRFLKVGGIAEVSQRPARLKNSDKITYAILHNKVSHIGAFPPPVGGDAAEETQQIAQAYRSNMDALCSAGDFLFRDRFEKVVDDA